MKRNELLFIALFTFIIALAWTGFAIYHKIVTSTLTADQQESVQPIVGNFDEKTIKELQTREPVASLFSAGKASTDTSSHSATVIPQGTPLQQNLNVTPNSNTTLLQPNGFPQFPSASGSAQQISSPEAILRGL